MDAYEATRVVFSRIQALDPENAAKIMGLLLIQDHGDQEMIRLAFGPDALLHSVVLSARDDLGLRLLPPPDASAYLLARQSPSPRLLSPSSWAPPPPFSRSHSSNGGSMNGTADDLLSHDDLFSPGKPATPSPFYGGDLVDDLQHHERLAFLNDPTAAQIGAKSRDLFYPDVPGECGSQSGNGDGVFYPYSMGWEASGHHRRSLSFSDLCVGSDAAGSAWKPCLYFARGHCKNGGSCRFLHGLPDDSAADATAAGSEMDAMVEQQYQELVHLRSKSQRLSGAASQLMASAATSPYPLTGTVPLSPSSSKCMNFLLQHQQQQNDTQRAAAAAVAAAALMLGGDEAYKFIGRSRIDRSDYAAGMVNPVLRQIYLTFPADSTFQEEDVSNYFSIYGPVQDVRIPYQQKRMFGFVTFVYPETVRLILAKGNPHFVCDARVLVKPYKEKGKVPDKYRRQQQQAGDFSVCTAPTGLDHRDPYELQHLVYGLRRKLEQQQQQQQAIELEGRRLMGLQLGSLTSSTASSTPEQLSPDDKSPRPHHHHPYSAAASATAISFSQAADRILDNSSSHGLLHQAPVNAAADKEESADAVIPHQDSDLHQSFEHNLPDSPFASPTRACPSTAALAAEAEYPLFAATSTLDMAPFKSCYFQMPRFSSGHGAVEM